MNFLTEREELNFLEEYELEHLREKKYRKENPTQEEEIRNLLDLNHFDF